MAARLYASGAVPSKREACRAVGLNEHYLSILSASGNVEVNSIIGEVDKAIKDETIALSKVIALMSRKAAKTVNDLMDSQNEYIALRASSDILDRNPESSKTFKASVSTLHLDGADIRELARALVAGAKTKEQFASVAAGDFVKVNTEEAVHVEGEETQPRHLESHIEGGKVALRLNGGAAAQAEGGSEQREEACLDGVGVQSTKKS
jgi:hypothetical protein